MKAYAELPNSIQLMIEDAVSTDNYGLQPTTLYKNVVGSLKSSSPEQVSKIFEISLTLCEMIKNENGEI